MIDEAEVWACCHSDRFSGHPYRNDMSEIVILTQAVTEDIDCENLEVALDRLASNSPSQNETILKKTSEPANVSPRCATAHKVGPKIFSLHVRYISANVTCR